jgi:DHA1 family tetracycline resistance protein-like MFS transporter
MMTGSGIIMPVFARRLGELGSGVEALGFLSMSFALAQLVSSPLMGSLADRFGRRPLVLVALAAFTIANVGFVFAPSTPILIAIRALGGSFTAGLFPASMGIIADIVSEEKRARWIGMLMGSYGAGLIFGPVLGGVLYDVWGFAAPFAASATMAAIAFTAAAILVPETRTREVRRREMLRQRWAAESADQTPEQAPSGWSALPRPLYVFGMLLLLDFCATFVYTFIEPQMTFYIYQELDWATTQFGIVAGAYGLAMVFGQTLLGRSSDRFGRKPMIAIGMILTAAFYASLTLITSYPLIVLSAVIAGVGEALASPARSAFYFDITPEQHRSRVVGIKGSASSLGGVVGPLLVVGVSRLTTPQGIFAIAGSTLVMAAILSLIVLKEPRHIAAETKDVIWQVSAKRSLAAQATLRGLVLSASSSRKARSAGN